MKQEKAEFLIRESSQCNLRNGPLIDLRWATTSQNILDVALKVTLEKCHNFGFPTGSFIFSSNTCSETFAIQKSVR